MSHFLVRRLLSLLLTLAAASVVIFVVLEVLPGDVAQMMMGPDADPAAVQALSVQLGLDQPAWRRYGQWLQGLFGGQLGDSVVYGAPVASLLAERLTLTVPLALLAMALTVLLAMAVGIWAALHHRRWPDTLLMGLGQLGVAVPGFWLGILLILVFSVWLGWLPSGGFDGWQAGDGGWWAGLVQGARALLLPALALACVQAAILARFVRTAMLEARSEAFVRTAQAKGLDPQQVLWRHVFRNAMIPVLTVAGMQFAELMAGAVVIENVFSLPGLGRLLFQSIANRDLVVVRNCVLLLVMMVVLLNFIVDVLYAWVDPRLRARSL